MTQRPAIRIMGIDPGSRVTGFGVIDAVGSDFQFVAAGCIRCGDGEFNDRLRRIYEQTGALLREWQPQQMAVEQVFVSQNAGSALKLGAARSAAICAGFEWQQVTLAEYAPRQIKQAVTGTGGADKAQVQHMIKALLKITGDLQADAADALAVAVCHGNSQRLNRRLAKAMAGSA
ncbi:MAG: crossover junction endodeoxyribonuclease RuvC [Pseudomonadota bacterium]